MTLKSRKSKTNLKNISLCLKEVKKRFNKIFRGSRKSRPIGLRINEDDLKKLKEKADKNGLPYQTMINVVIHKYVSDAYLDKEEIDKYLKLKAG